VEAAETEVETAAETAAAAEAEEPPVAGDLQAADTVDER
jgi:hypothetical protein